MWKEESESILCLPLLVDEELDASGALEDEGALRGITRSPDSKTASSFSARKRLSRVLVASAYDSRDTSIACPRPGGGARAPEEGEGGAVGWAAAK